MQGRDFELGELRRLFKTHPVVAILGARQVGKTTLALGYADTLKSATTRFDLESERDLKRLEDPSTALHDLIGLVVLDEIQRRPDLFPTLRVLADRPRTPARFLVLGSAAPALLRQSSESLAGRIAYLELAGFGLADIGSDDWTKLWIRGGYPRSLLARSNTLSFEWREHLVRTYLERDLPELGISIPPATLRRFWSMIAHYHGQRWNGAEFARAFAVSESTVRRYLDILQGTFMVRVLPAWSENLAKRQVKAPKVYIADCGLFHALMGLATRDAIESHPKVGASFEGFALQETIQHLGASTHECFFWATHQGAELDLLVVRGKQRLGFEFKRTVAPGTTPSMRIALDDLKLDSLDIVHTGDQTYPLGKKLRAVSVSRLRSDIVRLR